MSNCPDHLPVYMLLSICHIERVDPKELLYEDQEIFEIKSQKKKGEHMQKKLEVFTTLKMLWPLAFSDKL